MCTGVEGTSTRATNSSASSPSYAQQTFAINHPSLDPNLAGGGLPIPQSESTFAYGVPSAGHGHSEHLELPQPRPTTGPGRSRPVTAGEEEVPWWLYRAGYSPNPGLPYEPPGQSAHMHGTPGVYSDYGHFMSQSSPYLLGTPGTNTQASPAFVWHNNATSYRDYMATQQMNNYQPVPSGHAPASHTLRGHEQQHQPPVPSLHHHHSHPYLHAATAISGPTSNAHSAPGTAHVASQSGSQQPHRHDPSWGPMSMESSNSGHYALTSNGQEHSRARNSYSQGVGHQHQAESNTDGVPALGYDSGSSRMTSTESITSLNHLPTPVCIGTASAATTVADHHHYKGKSYSQSDLPSQDPSLRGRRSTSFDQVVSRASPINLRLPEDRKKRKFDSES